MTSLARIRPSAVAFTEHWNVLLNRSNNDCNDFLNPPGITIEARVDLDGGRDAPFRVLDDLTSADGDVRIGCVGLFRPNAEKTITEILADPPDTDQPLFSADERWRIWPADLAVGDAAAALKSPGSDYPVFVDCREIPIRNDGLYPITLKAYVISDDTEWLEYLAGIERRQRIGNVLEDAQVVFEHQPFNTSIARRSEFNLILELSTRAPPGAAKTGKTVRLSRLVLNWPYQTEAIDQSVHIGNQKNSAGAASYDPVRGALELGGLTAVSIENEWADFAPIMLRLSSPVVLQDMPMLRGSLEIETDGLISGLEPVVSDWQGNILTKSVVAKSTIRADIQIALRDLFRVQPYVTNGRIHLPGVDIDKSRLSIIQLLLRDMGFDIREPYVVPVAGEWREFIFTARRLEGGDWLYVDILVRTREREVYVQRGDKISNVAGHRKGGDTTIDVRGQMNRSATGVSRAVNIIQKKMRERLEVLRDRGGA